VILKPKQKHQSEQDLPLQMMKSGHHEKRGNNMSDWSFPNSTNISGFHYDENTKLLTVFFKSGAIYQYTDVPLEIVTAWQFASSAGSYHAYNIKFNYAYQRV
jgi:hypothetical protein